VRVDGKFELRDYPALAVAETAMAPDSNGADGSFNRLFGFITGRNETKRKIAMTTPVLMSGNETNRTMSFVLPSRLSAGKAPLPTDASVTLRELPAGQFAVLRFTGGRSTLRESEALERLQAWTAAQGLTVIPPPVFAYFDPPWTPGFLRRNEVMLRAVMSH